MDRPQEVQEGAEAAASRLAAAQAQVDFPIVLPCWLPEELEPQFRVRDSSTGSIDYRSAIPRHGHGEVGIIEQRFREGLSTLVATEEVHIDGVDVLIRQGSGIRRGSPRVACLSGQRQDREARAFEYP